MPNKKNKETHEAKVNISISDGFADRKQTKKKQMKTEIYKCNISRNNLIKHLYKSLTNQSSIDKTTDFSLYSILGRTEMLVILGTKHKICILKRPLTIPT